MYSEACSHWSFSSECFTSLLDHFGLQFWDCKHKYVISCLPLVPCTDGLDSSWKPWIIKCSSSRYEIPTYMLLVRKYQKTQTSTDYCHFLHCYPQLDSNILSLKTPQIWSQHMRNQTLTKLEASALLKFSGCQATEREKQSIKLSTCEPRQSRCNSFNNSFLYAKYGQCNYSQNPRCYKPFMH